jgi:hypothetical protein
VTFVQWNKVVNMYTNSPTVLELHLPNGEMTDKRMRSDGLTVNGIFNRTVGMLGFGLLLTGILTFGMPTVAAVGVGFGVALILNRSWNWIKQSAQRSCVVSAESV